MSQASNSGQIPIKGLNTAASMSNRLGSTLFVAALAHGALILGVTFTVGLPDLSPDETTIKVTLLAPDSTQTQSPQDSEYIANRDARGAGSADGTRPTTSLSSADLASLQGQEGATGLDDAEPLESAQPVEQLVTRANDEFSVNATPDATDSAAQRRERRANLLNVDARQTAAIELRDEAALAEDVNDDLRLSPSARASLLAEYLAGWRDRVEDVGSSNFPEQFLRDANGRRPTVEVAIGADGSLAEVIIQRSSGSRGLDQAALAILRMAAPFEPLPSPILDEMSVLRFAYEWDFIEDARRP